MLTKVGLRRPPLIERPLRGFVRLASTTVIVLLRSQGIISDRAARRKLGLVIRQAQRPHLGKADRRLVDLPLKSEAAAAGQSMQRQAGQCCAERQQPQGNEARLTSARANGHGHRQ